MKIAIIESTILNIIDRMTIKESTILNIIDRMTIKRLATRENIVIQAGNNKAKLSWYKPPY